MGAAESPLLLRRHLIDVDEYYRMAEVGLLDPEGRYELIEGEVIDMASIGSRHASAVKRLNRLLVDAVGDRGVVAVQDPLRLSRRSEPEPDLQVLKPRADYYADAHPGPADVFLVVEVAESSARYDREIKLPLYARYSIPEVWIIDLDAQAIRLHREPHGREYRQIQVLSQGGTTPLLMLPGVVVNLSGVLP